jgi:glutamate synthase (NADPH/NADH) small chain
MPKQTPEERVKNFDEVASGYSHEQALEEAGRCIQCKKRNCTVGCPVEVDIPEFILALREDDMVEAVKALKKKNALPGICGRVCPQETQCEDVCTLSKKKAPVAIGRLERYVADWETTHKNEIPKDEDKVKPTGKRIAVVGSGPAGLTVAADLAKLGHEVTLFEALHVAGGVLMYGIPQFRLPKEIVQGEVEYVKSLGAELELDSVIGKIATVDELFEEGYDAVFIGTGAGLPIFLKAPGENINGVYSANEFLTRINLMKAYLFPEYDTPIQIGENVAIVGGGNVVRSGDACQKRRSGECNGRGYHLQVPYKSH